MTMHIPALLASSRILAVTTPWAQDYHANSWGISALLAALPLIVLLTLMLAVRMKAHIAALITLALAMVVAIGLFHMPVSLAGLATGYGIAYGLFPIYWIVFPIIFMYELTVRAGRFALLQQCLTGVTADGRLLLLLIAFAFGAFFEGASGFGTPVAVCGTLLVGLGFSPLNAAAMALLANTAPVAFGALGTPVIALHGVTGIETSTLCSVLSAILTPFCIIVPFWLIWAFAGFKKMLEVWPAILISGVLFGFTQWAVATFHGPWLVDISASLITIVALIILFRFWHPKRIVGPDGEYIQGESAALCRPKKEEVIKAAVPWAILTVFVGTWGTPFVTKFLDSFSRISIAIPGLDKMVLRMPPVAVTPTPEAAVFNFNWLSATGTGILIAAILVAMVMKVPAKEVVEIFFKTLYKTRFTMITIATLMALGFLTRYCGLDAVLGLAFARTGSFYPFFGTLIGWLGTASTGSDTSSNVLFGSLQKLTAQQLNISPALMASLNSGGGVMGKMIAPQSVVVASTATGTYGKEGGILRLVILHSVALACLMGAAALVLVRYPSVVAAISR